MGHCKVLFHYEAGPWLQQRVSALQVEGLEIVFCAETDEARLFQLLPTIDVLWHVLRPVDAAVLEAAPRLKLIQKIGVGLNTIDLAQAKERGIAVCNMPGTNTQAVVEMTLLLMLATLRRLDALQSLVKSGQWYPHLAHQHHFQELAGKQVGLVGFGAVPKLLAPVLTQLGAKVCYMARSDKCADYPRLPLDQLLASSDILSLHLPLSSETQHLIDRTALAKMKPGAILINGARGGLVDAEALFDALTAQQLAGAGLDVFEQEPLPASDPLLSLQNVVVSPHAAWLTQETWLRSLEVAMANTLAIWQGEGLRFHCE